MRERIVDNTITVVFADDWTVLYVNGDLALENHSLRPDEVLRELGFQVEVRSLTDEQVEDMGWQFPTALEDVPAEE